MSTTEIIEATRSRAALFEMSGRGLLEVHGEDRVRWLDGMVSGDIEVLSNSPTGSGCYATLLTNRGAIVADLHIGRLEGRFLLESRRDQLDKIKTTLERFIIADDVTLVDRRPDFEAIGLEGPRSREILSEAVGQEVQIATDDWAELETASGPLLVGAFGFSGESAFQIHARTEVRQAIQAELEAAGERFGLVRGSDSALDVMRVEAGIPMLGSELDEDVMPAEARLEHAIANSKGCYVGQEIVARLRARGQVNHLLVGLDIEGDQAPLVDTELVAGGRRTGEITSSVVSPTYGPIALGFVRREHSEPGSTVTFEGGEARVAALPFHATTTNAPATP